MGSWIMVVGMNKWVGDGGGNGWMVEVVCLLANKVVWFSRFLLVGFWGM